MESHIDKLEFTIDLEQILTKLNEHDSKLKTIGKIFNYGTSGFRYNEKELDKVTFRVSFVTCLLSQLNKGTPMGIMITASHNKHSDNGIKIAGVNGEGISYEWEQIYTKIVNSKNLINDIKEVIISIGELHKNKYFFRDNVAMINLAYDTRQSSEGLANIAMDCLGIYNAKFVNYGVLTTPALQFLTLINSLQFKKVNFILSQFSFVDANEYWRFISGVYMSFNIFYEQFYSKVIKHKVSFYEPSLLIDCANGAAAYHWKNIENIFNNKIKTSFINTNFKNFKMLNEGCGAEHVHKEKVLPADYNSNDFIKNVSFDGDVDRIIYL
jgi:phosphoacetylglucosamine mutase